jgi:hypothetical protein
MEWSAGCNHLYNRLPGELMDSAIGSRGYSNHFSTACRVPLVICVGHSSSLAPICRSNSCRDRILFSSLSGFSKSCRNSSRPPSVVVKLSRWNTESLSSAWKRFRSARVIGSTCMICVGYEFWLESYLRSAVDSSNINFCLN